MRRALGAVLVSGSLVLPSGAFAFTVDASPAAPGRLTDPAPGGGSGDWMAEPLGLGVRELRLGVATELLVGEEDPPTKLLPGMHLTQAVIDVDADGDDELLQVRGALAAPKIALADGRTGAAIWSVQRPDPNFLLDSVPAEGGGQDILLFFQGNGGLGVSVLSGTTGAARWTRTLTYGSEGIGYFGVSQAGSGYDLVFGSWDIPVFQLVDLSFEFRSLATGQVTGSGTVTGEGQYPSLALAGDLDADDVGDVFALGGSTGFGAASGGQLSALTDRGSTEHWSTTFLEPVSDFTYAIGALDATGDGTRDVLLWSEFLGAGDGQTNEIVSIVDGRGGALAGLRPIARVDLDLWVHQMLLPGDINGDSAEEVIFSGAVLFFDGRGGVSFEAVGSGGTLWQATPDIAGASGGFGYDWNSHAGDLNGDGAQDALILMAASGVTSSIGLSQRSGAVLWRADSGAGAFDVPALTDLDGDGADDVVHAITGTRVGTTTIDVAFTAASGRDLQPLWSHEISLDAGSGFFFNAIGGHLDGSTARNDLIAEYTLAPSYSRHHAEALNGLDGSVLWTA